MNSEKWREYTDEDFNMIFTRYYIIPLAAGFLLFLIGLAGSHWNDGVRFIFTNPNEHPAYEENIIAGKTYMQKSQPTEYVFAANSLEEIYAEHPDTHEMICVQQQRSWLQYIYPNINPDIHSAICAMLVVVGLLLVFGTPFTFNDIHENRYPPGTSCDIQ